MMVKFILLNCNILHFSEAIDSVMNFIKLKKRSTVFFLNSDCVYKSFTDNEYINVLNNADMVLPDGVGLRLIIWFFGKKMLDNCNGTDFCPVLMEKLTEFRYKIFFLGGKEGVAKKAADNMRKKIPNITIVGTHSGYFKDDNQVIEKINSSGADVLFVAMGVPLQEKWIARNREHLNPRLCLGVGALLDFLSGTIPRAPKFMRLIHLEWLWRIIIEPKRMFKRYIIDGFKLFILVIKYKFSRN
ncbi:MAG: WecB/TagA/CpsF family glycosyltransferase [Candidatus Omnitrophica bacterium]|nr:WecB/TagA/CpsF family glycosyltransferase [Candidatus Omnitrophota bacterium]